MAESRSDSFVAVVSNLDDCGQAIPPVPIKSSPIRPNGPGAIQKKVSSLNTSPRRRSNRDINSIRLAGVGKTAHTFYRRMRTLFFSNPSQEEYQTLFLNGSRRRKNSNTKNVSCTNLIPRVSTAESSFSRAKDSAITTTAVAAMCSNPQYQNAIWVERATKPEEPAIYIIDNFLTNSELEYFDEKIASISFERSFVDSLEYHNEENCVDDKNKNALHDIVYKDQNQNDIAIRMKKPSVCDDNTSTSQNVYGCDQQNKIDSTEMDKIGGGNRKKRKRKTMVDDSHRTSTFYSFRKLHDTKISALEQRIANILGCWVHQIEALQLVQYLPGQFFGIHHDLGNLLEDDSVQLPRKDLSCKRRLVTIFCYLNTLRDDEGGCTYFPKCGHLRVRPKRGRAVLWCNITPDGKADSRTIHAGEAVKSNLAEAACTMFSTEKNINDKSSSDSPPGESRKINVEQRSNQKLETKKYGLNIWICEE